MRTLYMFNIRYSAVQLFRCFLHFFPAMPQRFLPISH